MKYIENIILAYQVDEKESAHLAWMLNRAASMCAISTEDLVYGVSIVAPTAAIFKVELRELIAAFGVLSNYGFNVFDHKWTESGFEKKESGVISSMRRLVKELLNDVWFTCNDRKSLLHLFQGIRNQSTEGHKDRLFFLQSIFNISTIRFAYVLVFDGLDEYKTLCDKLEARFSGGIMSAEVV